ncbi:unnamed protein product [Urochloa decumbens]|uniref:Uncharacterized protein n=1 Tax=Urochloa decumbens TaxID=240449 RepID=A0ABC8WCC8_9POAL
MEANGSQEPRPRHRSLSADQESLQPQPGDAMNKKGGWITFPFLAVAMLGLGVARGGAASNFVVYLVKKYNVPRVDAAQISSIAQGCLSLAPVGGAIIADAFFGCYPVVAVAMVFSVLALVMFTLTACLHGLRPAACPPGGAAVACEPASTGQMAALYASVFMLCVSAGGARFNQATLGASQFDAAADRDVLFNWYFVFFYASSAVGSTAIVYVQDNVSWALGYAISGAASVAGLAALLAGTPYYRRPAAQGSPFTGLARVAVAAARKWKVNLATASEEELRFYHGRSAGDKDGDVSDADDSTSSLAAPSDSFSFLNRAALITDGDVTDGSVQRPWRICTVREVEDFKAVLRILPLWTSSIVLSVAFGTQINFTVLQALAMDRAIGGGGFTVPAGSMTVVILVSIVFSLVLLDRALLPLWRRLTGHTPTPLQRIGAGHALAVLSLAASAAVERRRMATVREEAAADDPAWVSPLSATWLVLPLALAGASEALYFPGGVTLYYEEFPPPLRNTSTGMVAVIIALGFYLSTALVGIVRHATAWLPDNNMNASRLENVYWLLAVMVAVNFVYYLLCAKLYKYQKVGK